LFLTLGGRTDRQTYLSKVFAAGARRESSDEKLQLDHFTPKAALLYRLSNDHSVYINIGGGVEAPAFNEVDPSPSISGVELNPLLKSMTSTTYEIGMKGVGVFQSHILQSFSYSLAAYRISINNEIVPFNGGAWFFSAGKSQRTGFEFGGFLDTHLGVSLKAAFTYLDAHYRTYSNELGDFKGKAVPGIPTTVLNARVRYASQSGMSAELGMERVGNYFADDGNSFQVRSYFLLNVSAGYALSIGRIKTQMFLGINNLADVHYAASAFVNPVTSKRNGISTTSYLEPGLPRNLFGGINLNVDM
jgi:iron complex outermembrane receptor protein